MPGPGPGLPPGPGPGFPGLAGPGPIGPPRLPPMTGPPGPELKSVPNHRESSPVHDDSPADAAVTAIANNILLKIFRVFIILSISYYNKFMANFSFVALNFFLNPGLIEYRIALSIKKEPLE